MTSLKIDFFFFFSEQTSEYIPWKYQLEMEEETTYCGHVKLLIVVMCEIIANLL
jgi:hypothetical protein